MRPFRTTLVACLRLVRVLLHLLYGMLIVATIYPWARYGLRQWLKRRWSRQLLRMLGVGIAGTLPEAGGGELRVANHISWLDIFVMNAMAPVGFVAKADVRGWPLIGWLCAHTDTLFVERGSGHAARRTCAAIRERLMSGRSVMVFPEGTTSRGDCVLPFKSALLQGALDAGVPVRPLALRYRDLTGQPSDVPAYVGDSTLIETLWRIAVSPGVIADVHALPALSTVGRQRRCIAAEAGSSIALTLELPFGCPSAPFASQRLSCGVG